MQQAYDTRTYELAGIGERFIGLVIDSLIISVIGGIIGVSGNLWGGGILSFLLGLAYHWYFLTRQNGQTPGKMVMNIRVIKADGTAISDLDAVLRYAGYYLNTTLLMLGWVWALFDDSRQGLHDKLANTYVVKLNR